MKLTYLSVFALTLLAGVSHAALDTSGGAAATTNGFSTGNAVQADSLKATEAAAKIDEAAKKQKECDDATKAAGEKESAATQKNMEKKCDAAKYDTAKPVGPDGTTTAEQQGDYKLVNATNADTYKGHIDTALNTNSINSSASGRTIASGHFDQVGVEGVGSAKLNGVATGIRADQVNLNSNLYSNKSIGGYTASEWNSAGEVNSGLANRGSMINVDNTNQPTAIPLGQAITYDQKAYLTNGTVKMENITSGYGDRAATNSFHRGIDYDGRQGGVRDKDILASGSGKVESVKCSGGKGYGCQVVIDHGNGVYTRYAHLEEGSTSVKVGDTVKQGQQIATMGDSGSTGSTHLHYEVLNGGTNAKQYAVNTVGTTANYQNQVASKFGNTGGGTAIGTGGSSLIAGTSSGSGGSVGSGGLAAAVKVPTVAAGGLGGGTGSLSSGLGNVVQAAASGDMNAVANSLGGLVNGNTGNMALTALQSQLLASAMQSAFTTQSSGSSQSSGHTVTEVASNETTTTTTTSTTTSSGATDTGTTGTGTTTTTPATDPVAGGTAAQPTYSYDALVKLAETCGKDVPTTTEALTQMVKECKPKE